MKIALISPPLLKTPPSGYGGLEQVVYDLGCALVDSGDEVTLFAPPGSYIDGGKLFETVVAPERTDVNWIQLEADAYNKYMGELSNFDIVHDHTWFYFSALSKTGISNIKICHTHHGHMDWDPAKKPAHIKNVNLIAISDFMRREYVAIGWSARYVYNGVNLNKYPYSEKKGDRFVFVGRISTFKQPHLAIRAAIDTETPIDVIGGSFVDDKNFLEQIKRMCDDSKGFATLHLDLSHDKNVIFVQNAIACLVPSKMSEPFGLTLVESLACGTPVIALNDGAINEVVGRTGDGGAGYVCNTDDEFIKLARNIGKSGYVIEPIDCRNRAEYFSRENMAKRYKSLYKGILRGEEW
jgi:glycosyltransferase involved in cell wall biosynthesis